MMNIFEGVRRFHILMVPASSSAWQHSHSMQGQGECPGILTT